MANARMNRVLRKLESAHKDIVAKAKGRNLNIWEMRRIDGLRIIKRLVCSNPQEFFSKLDERQHKTI
jgi:hypothetical protein